MPIPKMGATGFAYDVARRFGLGVTEQLPGLVPLTATPETLGFDQLLAGVSLVAIVSCAGQSSKTFCSLTVASLAQPFFKSPPTGGRVIRSHSTCAGVCGEREWRHIEYEYPAEAERAFQAQVDRTSRAFESCFYTGDDAGGPHAGSSNVMLATTEVSQITLRNPR
jgi:hypothetical protein